MATPHIARPAPTCLSCLRRLSQPASTTLTPFSLVQTRGAKALTKAELEDLQGIPVRLLRDVVSFGRKDAIIRIKPGKMRNEWFPKNMAEYMTKNRFMELGLTEAAIGTRDRAFGTKFTFKEEKKTKKIAPTNKKETLTLPAEETQTLLNELLVPTLQFTRQPIKKTTPTPAPTPSEESAAMRSPSLAANAYSPGVPDAPPEAVLDVDAPTAIYGSVSTGDILARIKDALSSHEGGSRVALEADSISILGLEEGEDRIKSLGVFQVEIYPAKGMQPVRRTVEVVKEGGDA